MPGYISILIGLIEMVILTGISPSYKNPVLVEEFLFDKASFKSCHASTIAESGENLVVAYFGGTHEKHEDVEIWVSIGKNGIWDSPVPVADGISQDGRYPCWNPVLYQVPGGELLLFYKVGPDPESWWGMLKRSQDGGSTWSTAEKLPGGIIGPVKNKPILLEGGPLLCPSSTENNGWKAHMEMTMDFGESWGPVVSIDPMSKYEVIQPTILSLKNGWLEVMCRSKNGMIVRSFSTDKGNSWGVFESAGLPNPNSGIDAVTLSDGNHLLAYNHSRVPRDKWGGPRFPLNLAKSEDGISWEASLVIEEGPGEFSYPSIIQDSRGLVHVVYTWNREKIKHVVLDPSGLSTHSMLEWDNRK